MTVEVRFERGPFKSSSSEHLWLLLGVHEDGEPTGQVIVRVATKVAHDVYGGSGDPFWWYVVRGGADRLSRHQGDYLSQQDVTIELSEDDVRRGLHETEEEPKPLVADSTVPRAW